MTQTEIRKIQKDLNLLIEGRIMDEGDLGYKDTVNIDNGRITQEPSLVAVPCHTKDVSKIIKYCSQNSVPITTKSGGHSANGYCLNSSGIVLDLVEMNNIERIDERTLKVGTGTRWIQVYDYLRIRQSDRIAIGGGCPGVGVAGFLLGGGYSFISRSYGLGVDNVTNMEFVDINGDVYQLNDRTSSQSEKDLYWALKGAGGGNFGVITNVNITTHKTPAPSMMMGQITFPFYRIREIFDFYNEWVNTLPNELAVYGMLRYFPDPRQNGKPVLSLRFTPIYNGKIDEGLDLLKPIFKMLPKGVELHSMTLPEWENFIGSITLISGRSAYIRSVSFPKNGLTKDVADICMKYMSRSPSRESYIVWTHAGGAIKGFGEETSCFAQRDAEFVFEVKSIWGSQSPQSARRHVEWAVNFFDELEEQKSLGAYINYIDPLLVDWQRKYYGKHYKKLLEVKNVWDSKDQFGFQQGIGSNFQPDRVYPIDLTPLNITI